MQERIGKFNQIKENYICLNKNRFSFRFRSTLPWMFTSVKISLTIYALAFMCISSFSSFSMHIKVVYKYKKKYFLLYFILDHFFYASGCFINIDVLHHKNIKLKIYFSIQTLLPLRPLGILCVFFILGFK